VHTFRYIFPLLAAMALVPGCSDDPASLSQADPNAGSGDPGGAPDDTMVKTPATPAPAPPHNPTFAETTLARAQQWIDAQMPYCGGPNGGEDVICGGTCERTGSAKSAEWDKYRSDCSGFVSWSWALPAPGETTRTLAPYENDVSSLITVDELQPGDALNGSGTSHVMLFGGWTDKASGQATILQESRCGTDAASKIAVFKVIDTTTLQISDGRNFRPIRYKAAK
jgi:hypothetical protein